MQAMKIWIGENVEQSVDGELLQVVSIWPDELSKEGPAAYQELKYKWI
ncbi:hypothetical protein [Peribacillus kribbensis]|nr:hypothetical protein [Peribacillus kribbensis]